jgi:hypothetical protein
MLGVKTFVIFLLAKQINFIAIKKLYLDSFPNCNKNGNCVCVSSGFCISAVRASDPPTGPGLWLHQLRNNDDREAI